jgi:hypothetical protein
MTDQRRTSTHKQRTLTNEAGGRLHEMLNWHSHGDLNFAVVMWPRRGSSDAKVTTYTSTNDPPLGIKLAAVVSEHDGSSGDDD